MRRTLYASLFLRLVLVACGSPSSANNAQETKSDLVRLEVTNWSFVSRGPAGLIVSVPKGCKTVPQVPYILKGAPAGKKYNVAVNIATDNGAILTWFYGPTYGESTAKENKEQKAQTLASGRPIKQIGLWNGIVFSGTHSPDERMDELEKKSPLADAQVYIMYRGDEQVVVLSKWPKGNSAAMASAIAAAESFIKTVEINPNAKKIDFFPGAGEEPNMPVPKGTEVAMSDGMTVRATNKEGLMLIHAGPDLKRSYTWDGETRSVIMEPRAKRWYGSRGMYCPGPGDHWEDNHGITRGTLEEGQQDFKSEAEALKWINKKAYLNPVWTKTGLVIGWQKMVENHTLVAEVWQITINHKKPTNLAGANDSAIKITK